MAKKKNALPPEAFEFFSALGKKHGAKGGKKSLATMTPEERTARAKKASDAAAKVRTKKAKARKRAKAT